MRFRLRILLLLVVFGPPILAGVWQFESDSWPLFLALGFLSYFLFALAVGYVVAQAVDGVRKVL